MDSQNTQLAQPQLETRAIIIFGESQTCKSSFIDLLQSFGNNIQKKEIKIGQFSKGKSCTKKPEVYIFQSYTGYKLIIIDTQGFNDNVTLETDESIAINIQQFLASYVEIFIEYQVDRINFLVTECIEDNTVQLLRNLNKLNNLLGKNGFYSTMILLTKYNPQLLINEYFIQKLEGRVESVQEVIQDFEKEYGYEFNIKIMKFHTKIKDNNSIPELPDEFFIQQEQQLMESLSQIQSYPVQIFKEYAQFCQQRIQELCKTIDVGVIEYEQQNVSYTTVAKTGIIEGNRQILGMFGKKKIYTFNYTIQEPNTYTTKHQKQIRNEQDIKDLYIKDKKYKKEKQDKLDYLFKKYDK